MGEKLLKNAPDFSPGAAFVNTLKEVGFDDAKMAATIQVRSIQKFFTHRPVSTLDRVPCQLTGELFLYGMALRRRG